MMEFDKVYHFISMKGERFCLPTTITKVKEGWIINNASNFIFQFDPEHVLEPFTIFEEIEESLIKESD